jgi:predicted cobalt transporter CbtA
MLDIALLLTNIFATVAGRPTNSAVLLLTAAGYIAFAFVPSLVLPWVWRS